MPSRLLNRCGLFGHSVYEARINPDASTLCTRCGDAILSQGNTASHICHTLSCFLGRHRYIPVADRTSHHEYVCERCGHPLLLKSVQDPYTGQRKFEKRVDYVCGLLGHRVHEVANGTNTTEYACNCGHSFVRAEKGMTIIRHPLTCVLLGHLVKAHEVRGEWAEYVCGRCGHPFCFKFVEAVQEQRAHG